MNIRKLLIWLVVIAVVSLTIAIIAFFSTENNMVSFSDRNNFEEISIDEVKTFNNIGKLKEIYIHSVSSNVSVFSTEEEDVKIHFHGISAAESEKKLPELITNIEGSQLKIEIEYPKALFYNANLFLDVYVPQDDVYVPQDYLENVSIDTVSADVDISNLDIKNIQCKTVSGELRIESLGSDHLTLKTTSGNINILDILGDLKIDSVSGNVNVEYEVFAQDINIKTISGKVKIGLPENAEFYLKTNTVSGEVDTDFPITIISFGKMNQLEGKIIKS
ncbi:MAG: DUF4097 family beta strand repeat-containing protein [Promethearchaeota archaeon]